MGQEQSPEVVVVVDVAQCEAATTDPPVETLGRKRPAIFPSAMAEVLFCFSIMQSALMADYFVSGFSTVLPALSLSLDIPEDARTWPSSVLSLVAGALLLPLGRLADMYGGSVVFNAGFVWFTVWGLVAGFSTNATMLVVCRAMEGLGTACIMPSGITLLGKAYRPGPRKNFVFALYGALCPVGFFLGMLVGGLAERALSWRWYFWLGTAASAVGCLTSLRSIPSDFREARARRLTMDWWGAGTSVPGLLLLVYALTASTGTPGGWASPRIAAPFALGLALLLAAVYVEGWVAEAPLLPGDIFRVPYMKRMVLCLFVTYGVFGIYMFYSNFYLELVLHLSPLTTALWFAPWAAGGAILASTSGFVMHKIPGRILLVVCGVAKLVAVLLFALLPERPNYWAWVFPAMVAETACVDVLYTVSNVFITTSLPSHRQGLAGSLIHCTLFLGISVFLGLADLGVGAATAVSAQVSSLRAGYKVAFWIGVGFASFALLVFATIDIGAAKSDLTADEKMGLQSGSDSRLVDTPMTERTNPMEG